MTGRIRTLLVFQPLWVAALTLFSGTLLSGFQLRLHGLFWDHRNIYPAFAEHYDSLNRFGEWQWWSHNIHGGVPAYYLNILGHDFLTPLSLASSIAVWALGRVGIVFSDWLPFYCIYHGLLVQAVFLTGFYCFLACIVRDPLARAFGLVLGAFSPAAVAGVYGLGLEQVGYALLFFASWFRFTRNPCRSFLFLIGATASLFISLNHLFLYWVILFLPLMFLAIQFGEANPRLRPVQVILSMTPWKKWILLATVLIAITPALLTYSQGSDWLRSTSGTRIYNFEFLRPGNPLQLLATAVPGVGFQWAPHNKELMLFGGFSLTNVYQATANFFQYGYLGPLAGALVLYGFVAGLTPRMRQLTLVVTAGVLVIMLSGFSPFFAALLVLPSPLRAVNHYSDVAFTIGFSTILIVMAAHGFSAYLKSSKMHSNIVLRLYCCVVGLGVVAFTAVHGARWNGEWILGFYLVMALITALVTVRAMRRSSIRRLGKILLVLVLLDVSTNAFWWVRTVAAPITFRQGPTTYLPNPAPAEKPDDDYSNTLLVHQAVLVSREHYGTTLDQLPEFALANSVRAISKQKCAADGLLASGIVELPPEQIHAPFLAPFKREGRDVPVGKIDVVSRTYNSVTLAVSSDKAAVLFWRNLRLPSWSIEINGQSVESVSAYGALIATVIQAGENKVTFRFSPR